MVETPNPPVSSDEPTSITVLPSPTPTLETEESPIQDESDNQEEDSPRVYPEPLTISNDGSSSSIEYADYLLSLDVTDINSITLAVNKFMSIISSETSTNDS